LFSLAIPVDALFVAVVVSTPNLSALFVIVTRNNTIQFELFFLLFCFFFPGPISFRCGKPKTNVF
jgi:hypothetical protein